MIDGRAGRYMSMVNGPIAIKRTEHDDEADTLPEAHQLTG